MMSGEASTLEQLSANIARSIIERFATVREASPGQRRIEIKAFVDGDSSAPIDLGSFEVGQAFEYTNIPAHQSPPILLIERQQGSGRDDNCSPAGGQVPRRSNRSKRVLNDSDSEASKRRKITGGLRLRPAGSAVQSLSPESTDPGEAPVRSLQSDVRKLPQRRTVREEHALRPSTLNKLIVGIWEQIFGSMSFDMSIVSNEWREANINTEPQRIAGVDGYPEQGVITLQQIAASDRTFSQMNILCRKISQASRCSRALEVIVQASWIEHFDQQVQIIAKENPQLSATKAKMKALAQACSEIGWSEKEIRNKMAIWRGYKEIKDAGGWASLVFAGNGIYRFCKYFFDKDALQSLRRHRSWFEVAADTLHPYWREMLSIVDASSSRVYTGHLHDWVVSDFEDPVPLRQTYLQWDPNFSFTHLDSSVVDVHAFGATDPRLVVPNSIETAYVCTVCGEKQSDDARQNACRCFPNLYGSDQLPIAPVQIFRTKNGRNNGLMACCPFERGTAIGEFIGLVTKDLDGVDIMQAEAEQRYQIFQGREGNYTRFVNHSCRPNSQYERFVWMGVQRVILVSRGIEAGQEITVDYSDAYWRNLPKTCLCQESCCRFKNNSRIENA